MMLFMFVCIIFYHIEKNVIFFSVSLSVLFLFRVFFSVLLYCKGDLTLLWLVNKMESISMFLYAVCFFMLHLNFSVLTMKWKRQLRRIFEFKRLDFWIFFYFLDGKFSEKFNFVPNFANNVFSAAIFFKKLMKKFKIPSNRKYVSLFSADIKI